MNFTDTTHYLFPHEKKPGVENVLPWLDEALNKGIDDKAVTNTNGNENLNTNSESWEERFNRADNSDFPAMAIHNLQQKFTTYDTDKSGTLDFKELDANAAADPAAQWALSRYTALSKLAGDGYLKPIGLERIGTYIPDNATEIQFKDTVSSLAGISRQDLTNAMEMSNTLKMQQVLEMSRSHERKGATYSLVCAIGNALLTYPAYKGLAKRSPALGWIVGGLTAFGAFKSYGNFNDKRHGNNTEFLASQINETRKMMGLSELATSSPDGKNDNQTKDKAVVNEGGLEQCRQKSTSDDLIEQHKKEDLQDKEKKQEEREEASRQNSGNENLDFQIINNQTGIK